MTVAAKAVRFGLPDGRTVLAGIAKRAYTLELARTPRPRDEPPPLFDEPVFADPRTCQELLHDADALAVFHSGVDVVVIGRAHAQRSTPQVDAALTLGPHQKRLRVFGDRVLEVDGRGVHRISAPHTFDSMPLTYQRAYGGGARSPYPRNPIGLGYLDGVVAEHPATTWSLPNFEDPSAPLTSERLLRVDPARWVDAPLPVGLGCLMPYTFPRAALLYPIGSGDAARVVAHERPDLDVHRIGERGGSPRFDAGAASSASCGLRCLPLRGDEPMALEHLHPDAPLVASRLPGARVVVTFRQSAARAEVAVAALRKVVLAPDERRMTLTYVATVDARTGEASDDVGLTVDWS